MSTERSPMFGLYRFHGETHSHVGETMGKVMKQDIQKSFEFYHTHMTSTLGYTEDELKSSALSFKDTIEKRSPQLSEEINGVAKGSQMEQWKIYMMNARSEFVAARPFMPPAKPTTPAAATECTSFADPNNKVLAQTWDFDESLESVSYVVSVKVGDGVEIVMVMEAGLIGKFGMNSLGVGVSFNMLGQKEFEQTTPTGGCVPIHVLLREALMCDSTDSAVKRLTHLAPHFTSGRVTVMDKTGECRLVEIAGPRVDPISPADIYTPIAVHSNHYLRCGGLGDQVTGSKSSYARLERGKAIVDKIKADGKADDRVYVMSVFKKELVDDETIVRRFSRSLDKLMAGTLASAVTDLVEMKFWVTRGRPWEHSFDEFTSLIMSACPNQCA